MTKRGALATVAQLVPLLAAACGGGGVKVGGARADGGEADGSLPVVTPDDGGTEAPGAAPDAEPCHACTLWDPSSCGQGLSCQPRATASGACLECRPAGAGKDGDLCTTYGDCAAGFGCVDGLCHAWCAEAAPPGGAGACTGGRQCLQSLDLQGTGAGLCLPCGECQPLVTPCGPGLSCSTTGGCSACHQPGPMPAGGACSGHSDCQRTLSCISGACRASCLTAAAPDATGACAAPLQCVGLSDAGQGACLPCGECSLFASGGCQEGFKCAWHGGGCMACLPSGPLPPGSLCTDHSECQTGLQCVDDVCRAYCLTAAQPGDTGACGPGFSCVALSDEPTLGSCLPCGECGGPSSPACRPGLACRAYGAACSVCGESGPQARNLAAGESCQVDVNCASHTCVDGVCRSSCPPSSASACAPGELCTQLGTTAGTTVGACLPCGECTVLGQPQCKDGLKCVAFGTACSLCIAAGTRGEGDPCGSLTDCASPLTCANGVCRAYCRVGDRLTCAADCVAAPSSLPANIGQCLHCGQCFLWSADSCNSPDLKCNDYSSCAVCEGRGGSGVEGSVCRNHGDCSRDLHCFGGVCRAYCKLDAAPGQVGACGGTDTCQVAASFRSSTAGVCCGSGQACAQ